MSRRSEIMDLWRRCFDESDDFLFPYFNLFYREEDAVSLEKGGEVQSSVLLLPYRFAMADSSVSGCYLSGVCTRPEWQHQGLMHQLMHLAHEKIRQKGYPFAFLILQHPDLADLYRSFGYEFLFTYVEETFEARSVSAITRYDADRLLSFYQRHNKMVTGSVQHSLADLRLTLSLYEAEGGGICGVGDGEDLQGVAIYKQMSGYRRVMAWHYADEIGKAHLLDALSEGERVVVRRRATADETGLPYGMVKFFCNKKEEALFRATSPYIDLMMDQ